MHATAASSESASATREADTLDVNLPGRVFNQIGPWAMVPIWILRTDLYLPGANPDDLKPGDEKPLTGAELRVYIAMRSYADADTGHFNPFVRTLAERAGVDKTTAERAVGKFKRLGWLATRRRYRPDGSIWRCDYFMCDICPPPYEGGTRELTGTPPAGSRVPHPRTHGSKNTPDEHTKRTHQGSDRSSLASGRFAPSDAGAKIPNQRTWSDLDQADDSDAGFVEITNEEPRRSRAEDLNADRVEDREVFHALVGDKIRTDGSVFGAEGVYRHDQFYTAFRKWKRKKPIRWPGRMLQAIADCGDNAVEDWLLNVGLESVE